MTSIQEKLALLEDAQVELHLLRSCLNSCKIIHLLRTVPSSVLQPFLCQFDLILHNCLSCIINCSLSDPSWCQASLPFRLDGLGLRESIQSAAAAFLGSYNSICDLASRLLFIASDQLHFSDEDVAAAMFSDIPISSASQHDLQAFLDQHQFNRHFASCSIRNRARLTALSHSSGTSSVWLKAIPSTSLGLAISGLEFIVSLRLWLGVSLFPISPLCTCLSSIDCYGDHLLDCSHGPMRIRRHDALVNILHHALLQDHTGVLKEQRASFDGSSHPGNIFHPDYQLGRPAYYDVSVRSTTQPVHISFSASFAGVVAAAGEVAKDAKHLATVEKAGGDFIPLVVESFGIWTPFALSVLNSIADRTTTHSGISPKVARRNLLQQLFVCL